MRRVGVLLMVALAVLAMAAADASAQPKVTITGFVDNVASWTKNMSVVDINTARVGDRELYARTRVRPDITAEVGTTKFVLGMEIDAVWGQTAGGQDTNVCLSAACPNSPQRSGASAGWDLNTDTQGIIEIKWGYTEFMIPGFPGATVFRIGAQPFQTQYKLAAYGNGDFPGVNITSTWSPMVKTNFTYAFIEEQSTGVQDGFVRGEDFAIIASVEVTPIKGLDIRPLFSWAQFVGPTSSNARQGRAGVGTGLPGAAGGFSVCPGTTGPGTGNCPVGINNSSVENRYTVGVDARWRFGAFSLDPTFFYQFGSRDVALTTPNLINNIGNHNQSIDAWLADIRGGWQAGPLLLEGAFIYSSGNKKTDRLDLGESKVKFYQPLDTDTSYYATWAEIWALGIDYFNIINSGAAGLNPGVSIGYDKYGLMRLGFRASYALTPAFTMRFGATGSWTAHETAGTLESIFAGTGRTPCTQQIGATLVNFSTTASCQAQLDAHSGSQYLGSELNLGFQWRFVPNVALDVVGSYEFSGPALAAASAVNATTGNGVNARDPKDIAAITARIRYSW